MPKRPPSPDSATPSVTDRLDPLKFTPEATDCVQ